MKTNFYKTIVSIISSFFFISHIATAQTNYPEKPVRLVVPYTPAGSADQLARSLAESMGKILTQSIVIENKPGASTRLGASYVARSPADGYTLFLASNSSIILNPMLYKNLSYDAEKDFEVIAIIAEMPLVVVTNTQTNFNTLQELANYAKEHPNKLNYASIGTGNPLQLATELLLEQYGIKIVHIPFNGSSPALTSLMANETQLMIDGISSSLPLIEGNRLKALAVTSTERLKALPNTPTVTESNNLDYKASTWFGIAAPKGTPKETIEKLRQAINEVLIQKEFQEKFQQLGLIIQKPKTIEELNAFLSTDKNRWQEVIRKNNISLD